MSDIKSYKLEEAKQLVQKTFDDFNSGENSSIGEWEYDSLYKLINTYEQFEPINNNVDFKQNNLTYEINPNIYWKIQNSGVLKPFFKFHNIEYSLKSYSNILKNNINNKTKLRIEKNTYSIIENNSNEILITCPECGSTNIKIIEDNPYCASPNCDFWFKHFYIVLTSYINDDLIKYFIKNNVSYKEFNIIKKIFNTNFFNEYFNNIKTLSELYKIKSSENRVFEDCLSGINYLRSVCNKNYIDMISKHLIEYLKQLEVNLKSDS